MNRTGFTFLEMALASVIGSVAVLICFGLMTMIERTDRQLAARYDDMAEFAQLHGVFQRAMQNLVAEPAGLDDDRPANQQGATSPGAVDEPDDDEEEEEPARPPRFWMGPIESEDFDDDELEGPWKIEMVLQSPPFAYATDEGPVRGVIEKQPDRLPDGRPGWKIVWRQIRPRASEDEILLADDLDAAWFACVMGDGAVAELKSWKRHEFPRALRIAVWGYGGHRVDWMFEPGIITGDGA